MTWEWKEKISDPKVRKVLEALSDPAWDFRTTAGIAEAVGLSESEVSKILNAYPEFVRKSAVPDHQRRELFTLSSKPQSAKERIALLWTFVTKSVR